MGGGGGGGPTFGKKSQQILFLFFGGASPPSGPTPQKKILTLEDCIGIKGSQHDSWAGDKISVNI